MTQHDELKTLLILATKLISKTANTSGEVR